MRQIMSLARCCLVSVDRRGDDFGGLQIDALLQVLRHAFEQIDEALRARIHDAGFAQFLELVRRCPRAIAAPLSARA